MKFFWSYYQQLSPLPLWIAPEVQVKKNKTAQETVQQTKTVVTAEAYIRAQTGNMFQAMINNSGGTVETEINGVLSACALRDLDHHSNTPTLPVSFRGRAVCLWPGQSKIPRGEEGQVYIFS